MRHYYVLRWTAGEKVAPFIDSLGDAHSKIPDGYLPWSDSDAKTRGYPLARPIVKVNRKDEVGHCCNMQKNFLEPIGYRSLGICVTYAMFTMSILTIRGDEFINAIFEDRTGCMLFNDVHRHVEEHRSLFYRLAAAL